MNNNVKRDTYDKLIGSGSAMLFSDSGFDEMQKAKNYEIGFRLFRAFFWSVYIASFLMFTAASGLENTVFTAVSIGFMVLCTAFYLIYAARTSAAGVMNRKYAEQMSRRSTLFTAAAAALSSLVIISTGILKGAFAVMWAVLVVFSLGNWLCARRNMKVLEKMLKDESEEE